MAKSQGLTTQIKCPQSSYLLIRLILCFSEESDVLDESGLDVLIVHELAEYVKLLPQELVGKINLMEQTWSDLRGQGTDAFLYTHRGVHYACAVGPDGVGDVTDVDGVQVLIVTCLLNENLKENAV